MSISSGITFAEAVANVGLSAIAIFPKRGMFDIQLPNGAPLLEAGVENAVIPNVTLSERSLDRSIIAMHPVQQGSASNDHIFRMPAEVILTISWSKSPRASQTKQLQLDLAALLASQSSVLNAVGNTVMEMYAISNIAQEMFSPSGQNMLQVYYQLLLSMKNSFCVFDLYTGKRVYKNMVIKMLSNETDFRTENSLPIICECQEFMFVNTETVDIPASTVSPDQPTVPSTVDNGDKALETSNSPNPFGYTNTTP